MVSRLAVAGLTAMPVEVAPVKAPLVKAIVILVAVLAARLLKLTNPLIAATLVVPSSVPLPAARLAVTVRLLGHRFPNESSTRTTGCGEKTAPTVAVAGGWVAMVSRLADAALTTTLLEPTPARTPLAKLIVIVSA